VKCFLRGAHEKSAFYFIQKKPEKKAFPEKSEKAFAIPI